VERKLDEALAVLIASTRRVRRKLSLLQIAEWLEVARRELGGLQAVAERIGLSEEMLRQFGSVRNLSPGVKKLVAQRRIDSVDVAHRLTKLAVGEQLPVARALVRGQLNSDDVRAIVSLRRSAPTLSLQRIIQRVKDSENIREYLAYFAVPPDARDKGLLRARLGAVVGDRNIRSLTIRGALGTVALSAEGRGRLAQAAKDSGLTKRALVNQIAGWGVQKPCQRDRR